MIKSCDNEIIEINYLCQTVQVSYSVADYDGNVMKRGDYNSLPDNKLAIHDLPGGYYTLCIIDGDKLFKSRFQKK